MSSITEPSPSAAGIRATFAESPLAVKAVLVGVFISKVGNFLGVFLVLFLTAEGYSAGQAATALGVWGGGAVVGVLAGGALADRLGARDATVIGMVGTALLTASLLYVPNYASVLVAVALLGAVAQIYRPASATLLTELTPESRTVMVFAMYRFGLNLGTMAAPLIGYALYHLDRQDYDLLFWGEALIALAYAVLAWVALPASTRATADDGAAAVGGARDGADGYLAVLRDRRYVLYLVAALFNGIVYVQYLSTLPLDVTASGVDLFWFTLAVSLNGLIVITCELPLTKISQHWPLRVSISIAYGLVGVGVAVYALPMGPAIIVIGTIVWTIGEVLGGPAVFAYPGLAGPAKLRSRYVGSFQFMFALGFALGPVIGGLLFVRLGHGVWPVVAIAGLVAAALATAAVRPAAVAAARAETAAAGGAAPPADTAAVDPDAGPVASPDPAVAPSPDPTAVAATECAASRDDDR